ncbi:MAG TPA: hypothetical protein VIL88_11515 [Devosia sp.]|jgi:hypothetical protein|uniref:hypothetical protein n=1 Tax=Devosia sp. TaxID=1871048 RepID=UPI002F93D6E6
MIYNDQDRDVWGSFTWAARPTCTRGRLAEAVEEKLIFVSTILIGEGAHVSNLFYVLPVSGDGFFALNEGIVIPCCPWCGDKISGRRRNNPT